MGDTEFYFCLLRTLKVLFSALKNGLWGFDVVITGKYRSKFLDTVRKICVLHFMCLTYIGGCLQRLHVSHVICHWYSTDWIKNEF